MTDQNSNYGGGNLVFHCSVVKVFVFSRRISVENEPNYYRGSPTITVGSFCDKSQNFHNFDVDKNIE